jgi:16S rRNA processing protein RimM
VGRGFLVRFEGSSSRDAAAALTGCDVWVARSALPPTSDREIYWADLVGLVARNVEGATLGRIDHIVDAPGNAVMVVRGERERWVPLTPRHLLRIERAAGCVVVDWPEEF